MSKTHMIGRFAKKLGLFRRDQRGNVAVIVGAAIIPLVGALGLATDTARGYLVKARLSQALDAAALAGGKVYFSTQRDADIKKYFAANFPSASLPVYDSPYKAIFMDAKVTLHAPGQRRHVGQGKPDAEGAGDRADDLHAGARTSIPSPSTRPRRSRAPSARSIR